MSRRMMIRLLLLSSLLAPMTGCRTTSVDGGGEPSRDLAGYETYAWVSPEGRTLRALEGGLRQEVMHVADEQLSAMGLIGVTPRDADLLLSTRLTASAKLQATDPYYSFHAAEKVEDGTLELSFVDAATSELLWKGSSRRRLRRVAKGVGLYKLEFVETGEERDWRLREMVERILSDEGLRKALARGRENADRRLGGKAKRALYRQIYETTPERATEVEFDPAKK